MSAKKFYHEIDLSSVGQLLNSRIMNVTTEEELALSTQTLGPGNKGLVVYNVDDSRIKTWNGTSFDPFQIDVSGDIKFKGLIDAEVALSEHGHFSLVPGSQYIVVNNGTLDYEGATFEPTNEVEHGDHLLVGENSTIFVIQRNDTTASESIGGNIAIATVVETLVGDVDDEAVTPATLAALIQDKRYVSQSVTQTNLTANVPMTVVHNLNLDNMHAFTISIAENNAMVYADVDVVDSNTVVITSLSNRENVTITIHGFSNTQTATASPSDGDDTQIITYSLVITEPVVASDAVSIALSDDE